MLVVRRDSCLSLWMNYILLFSSLQLWNRVSSSTVAPRVLPAPELRQTTGTRDRVVLTCQAPEGHLGTNFTLFHDRKPVASVVNQHGTETAHYTVSVGEEGGLYCCLYQNNNGVYSGFSQYLTPNTQQHMLPAPTLSLQEDPPGGLRRLLCSGSASYPGSTFSLYQLPHPVDGGGAALLLLPADPAATQRVPATRHHAVFPLPVQDGPSAWYRCQYTVLLGRAWSSSEHSLPLAVATSRGPTPPSTTGLSGADWPLVLGSISAVVMFGCALALVGVVAYRKVQAVAKEKKKREEAQFWTKVRAKDHVVDYTLRPMSSQDWADTSTVSRTPLWNALSTFANQNQH